VLLLYELLIHARRSYVSVWLQLWPSFDNDDRRRNIQTDDRSGSVYERDRYTDGPRQTVGR